jgi:hypothetical protein
LIGKVFKSSNVKDTNMATTYEKFTYDLGNLKLSKAEKVKLEADFDDAGEYIVCTDETADVGVKGQILSSLWAFSSNFLAGETGLPSEVFSCLQEKMSEDANETIHALVKATCGEASLVDSAVCTDGRGHFLATYDGDEQTYTTTKGITLFVYRCN